MPTKTTRPELSLTGPIGGSHHCIGSSQAVIDLAFRYLHATCASHGGRLTEAELIAAQAEIIDSFSDTLDYFELIHKRCMDASGVTAPVPFAQGRMLPSLLSICSQRIAAHCFALQVDRLGADWLKLFFDAFSVSIRKYGCADAETRLGNAYTKAAGNLRQKLSIKTLLLEQGVQDALRDCIAPFAKPDACNAMTTAFTDEINHWIGKQSGSVCPHVSKITNDQMRKFLNLFPCEVGINLKSAVPTKSKAQSGSASPQSCESVANC